MNTLVPVVGANKKRPRNLGKQFADAMDRMEKIERKLAATFTRWNKARLTLKRIGKRLDEEMKLEHGE